MPASESRRLSARQRRSRAAPALAVVLRRRQRERQADQRRRRPAARRAMGEPAASRMRRVAERPPDAVANTAGRQSPSAAARRRQSRAASGASRPTARDSTFLSSGCSQTWSLVSCVQLAAAQAIEAACRRHGRRRSGGRAAPGRSAWWPCRRVRGARRLSAMQPAVERHDDLVQRVRHAPGVGRRVVVGEQAAHASIRPPRAPLAWPPTPSATAAISPLFVELGALAA